MLSLTLIIVQVFIIDSQWMKKFKKAYYPQWLDIGQITKSEEKGRTSIDSASSPRKRTDSEDRTTPQKQSNKTPVKEYEKIYWPPLTNERIVLSHSEVIQQNILVLSKKRAAILNSVQHF
jgi:hypothetical protein